MERPTSITVIAILQIICAVLPVIVSLLGLLGGALLSGLSESADGAAAGGLVFVLSLVFLGLGVALLVLTIGLLMLKGWAWVGTLIVQGLGILLTVLSLINGSGGSWLSLVFPGIIIINGSGGSWLSLVFSGVIIWVLFQPNVKRAFGQA